MAQFRIPYEYRNGYTGLANLSDTQRQDLLKMLSDYSANASQQDIAGVIAGKISITEGDALDIVKALSSLAYAREDHKVPVDQIVSDLRGSFDKRDFTNMTADKADSVADSIRAFLNTKGNYYLSNKARQLSFKREKTLTRSRILTDVRPIFADDESMEVEGETIIHTLQIDYNYDSLPRTVQIALDSVDLADLKAQIQRAERKESLLREYMHRLPNKVF